MFEYFYHEILKKTVVSFGTLFNNISIRHKNSENEITSVIKVPLAYGPVQKFLARVEQSPDLDRPIQITLPRMSFEFIGLSYDPSRKSTTTQSFLVKSPTDGTETKKSFLPVPYNMQFELNIMTKLNDDALQIVEQILPYFQPSYSLTVNFLDTLNEKRDVPIILENISMQDDYDGDFKSRRVLIYTLRFAAKTYLFGPISSASSNIIKSSSISFGYGNSVDGNKIRDIVYSATPRALKSYTGNTVATIIKDVSLTDAIIEVNDTSSIDNGSYLEIAGEQVYVKSKTNTSLVVERGKDGTEISLHLIGEEVKLITSADNELIEYGDDFGFNGEIE